MVFCKVEGEALSVRALMLVALLHLVVVVGLIGFSFERDVEKPKLPMMVSLLSKPAPLTEAPTKPVTQLKQTITPTKKIKKTRLKVERKLPKDTVNPDLQVSEISKLEVNKIVEETSNSDSQQPNQLQDAKEAKELKSPDKTTEEPQFGVSYLHNPPPKYPLSEKLAGNQGKVILRVLVNALGEPEELQIHQGSGYGQLDTSALEAVKKWRFIPAKLGGEALSAYVLVPVRFSLTKSK